METGITFTFAAIFLGAAVLSSIALYAKQPIIIAYIALGVALGPYGLGVVSDMDWSPAQAMWASSCSCFCSAST